jgi:DNA primase
VDRERGRYHWNARGESGDALDFLRRQEGLSLPEAVARLGERVGERATGANHPRPVAQVHPPVAPADGSPPPTRGAVAALGVAVAAYHAALLAADRPRAYLARRGVDAAAIRHLRLGWCDGARLGSALDQAAVPRAWAREAGLLAPLSVRGERHTHPMGGSDEREFLAGRVVVPEVGPRGPVWLIGRALPDGPGPRYLGLPLRKPLLGYHLARASPLVLVTEGVFDALALLAWGLPGVGICGTDPGRHALAQLRALAATRRVVLVPQADAAGREAAARLAALLAEPPPIVALPAGVKDLGELAERPEGRATFLAALPAEVRATLGTPPPTDAG